MKEFFKSIQTLFETTNAFNTALDGQFYFGIDESSEYPYGVYFGMPGIPEGDWETDIDNVSFQVNCYSKTANEAIDLLTKCRALFDGATLTVTGYQDLILGIQMFTPPWRDGDRWAISVEFQTYLIEG